MGDPHMGLQARLMSQALRKLTSVVSRNQSIVIFINQIRMKIGVVFGNPETTTGGHALKFYASVRLDIRRIGQVKDGDAGGRQPDPREGGEEQGRAAVPGGRVRRALRRRVDRHAEALDLAVERGLLEKSGAHFALEGERIGQGRERAIEWLRGNAKQFDALVTRIGRRAPRAVREVRPRSWSPPSPPRRPRGRAG